MHRSKKIQLLLCVVLLAAGAACRAKDANTTAGTAGVRPIDKIGQITLKPIDLAGCKGITLNADASGGAVRVELLDEHGRRLHGFTRDDAESITTDGLRHAAKWKGKAMSDLPPGHYTPRLHLENAEVFAMSRI